MSTEKQTVGSLLRAQREALHMDLDAVCRKTYIRRTYLEAIEAGDYKAVGDPVYARGFIRNFAEAVGLDGLRLTRMFNEEINAASSASVAAPSEEIMEQKRAGGADVRVAGRGRRRGGRRPFTRLEWAILFLGALAVAFFWIWLLYL